MFLAATTYLQAQDENPYAQFGYEGKVLKTPQERQQFMLKVPNPDIQSEITLIAIAPNEGRYYFFNGDNQVIKTDTLPNTEMSRWLSIDPLVDKYPSLSPYNFTNNTPIQAIDTDGRDWFILAWAPRAGDNQGHVAIAITNYKEVEGKLVKDGYIIFEAREKGANDLVEWVQDPSRTVEGQVTASLPVGTLKELLNYEINLDDMQSPDGVVRFSSGPEEDMSAIANISNYVTEYEKIKLKEYDYFEGSWYKKVTINPIKYSLTTTDPTAYSCAGFASCMAQNNYDVNLGNPENINFRGRSNILTPDDGYIDVPSQNVDAYTPGSIFMNAVRAGGTVIKNRRTDTSSRKYYSLERPFVDVVTGGRIKDLTPTY